MLLFLSFPSLCRTPRIDGIKNILQIRGRMTVKDRYIVFNEQPIQPIASRFIVYLWQPAIQVDVPENIQQYFCWRRCRLCIYSRYYRMRSVML